MSDGGLRLMFYDRTCTEEFGAFGLTQAWWVGGILYDALGRLDAHRGVATWEEGLDWLLGHQPERPIAEIQFWGHGKWGGLWMDEEVIGLEVLSPGHRLYQRFAALRQRLLPGGQALWWFRCCDTFGTERGHELARGWTRFYDCRAAGHTHHIGFLQSGLQVLEPGAEPGWPASEGVVPGLSHARHSSLRAPRTITCLRGAIPDGWG